MNDLWFSILMGMIATGSILLVGAVIVGALEELIYGEEEGSE